MQRAIEETARRRKLQEDYNTKHGITPASIRKSIRLGIEAEAAAHARANAAVGRTDDAQYITEEYLAELEAEMFEASEALDFERAAAIRDQITRMRESIGKTVAEVDWRNQRREQEGKGRKNRARVPRPKKRA
jgi:excinuclease ABC subunit B